MKIDDETLNKIYDKTRGKCHLCHKKLAFSNYGVPGARGAWEIEHSKPKSKGGTDHLNNLYPAHIKCNRQKNNGANKSIRSKHGVRNAPLSYKAKRKKVIKNAIGYTATGVAIGRIFGPGGMLVGGAIGAILGSKRKTDQ
ncbi:MAG: HNH endonuclease [Candidatus Thiodiazotropha sp. (ex Monitilora ramsayi)]|nr:HNH endonuclease [Candidatus Thiodiazotropha sp. (ex Monitilora ramsayi)]